ncbi:MAG: hypothetical protein ACE15D_05210 [Candidatus Eisenbacteria bacterium]|nr:hypothetical protein [Candidatus Eisenbacteria bacterium]
MRGVISAGPPRPLLPLVLVSLALLATVLLLPPHAGAVDPSEEGRAGPPVPAVALEDTLDYTHLPFDEVEVRAHRLSIGEIVDRCIRQEEALQAKIASDSYTQQVKAVLHVGGDGEGKETLLVTEESSRVFYRKGKGTETVLLQKDRYKLEGGQRKEWPEESDSGGGKVEIRYEDFHALPFYLEDREQYDFRILSRHWLGGKLIYEVTLEPKSDFAIAPSGRIWIDTTDFQILREEFDFRDRVPMPMFVKSIGPFVRERERIGGVWVWKRVLVRADLHAKLLRFLDKEMPSTVEMSVTFAGHEVTEEAAQ